MQQSCFNNQNFYYPPQGYALVQQMPQGQMYPQPAAYQPGVANSVPKQGPSAVNINILGPQAFDSAPASAPGISPMYGPNVSNMPIYPANYNVPIYQQQYTDKANNGMNAIGDTPLRKSDGIQEEKPKEEVEEKTESKDKDKDKKPKKVTPLTDDYVKSLENYFNNDNPKIRLMAATQLLERFKEDDNRRDNPCLIPLLNKALKDTSPSVRFIALTTLQSGYCVGDDETVALLNSISKANTDKFGQDALLADEILLKLSAPESVEVQEESKQ